MTLLVLFHMSRFRDFKYFYNQYVKICLRAEFPQLVSYTRMLTIKKQALIPLCAFLSSRKAKTRGISFIDSTKIAVCHNLRIPRNKVFEGIAQRGKNSMGWFYGFKLHFIVNDSGERLSVKMATGNVDDRQPVMSLCEGLSGHIYSDKGYISQSLNDELALAGITLVTNTRNNMKPKDISLWDRIMLRKRYLIETIFDQLKNISHIEHTRHRNPLSLLIEVTAGLLAYTFYPKNRVLI